MISKEVLIKVAYFLLGLLGIYIVFKYILGLMAPFIIAWLLASLLNPFVTWANKKFGISRGVGTILSIFTILSAFFALIGLLIQQLMEQILAFINAFPIYQQQIMNFMSILEEKFASIAMLLPLPDAFSTLDGVIAELLDYIGKSLGGIATYASSIVSTVPNGIFFIIIMLISVFFMTRDNRMIREFIKAQIPKRVIEKALLMQNGLKSALGGYVKTQLILMCYTFCICLVGLFILQREYVLLISLGIAIFDALPAFGSGAVLIPWGIYYLIIGDYALGMGLLMIYGLILVMRQIMEPRVLSKQIGIYALVTLMAMYVGLKTVGVFGIIIGPIVVVSIQTLQRVGVIPDFKRPAYKKESHK